MSPAEPPELSVVVPVFNEAGNAAPLAMEIRAVMVGMGRSFEIVFVNDGSSDGTLQELLAAQAQEPRLRIVDLDGNFGEAAALSAGFHRVRGNLVITLDGDGQNDPHDIPALLDALDRRKLRVVSGWRQRRQEGYWLRILPSRLANRAIAAVTRLPVHDNGCGLKVYHRDVIESAQLPRGFNRFMPAIFGVRADEVGEVVVTDRQRQHGESHYGLSRTLVVLRDLLALPLILAAPRRSEAIVASMTALIGLGLSVAWVRGRPLSVATLAMVFCMSAAAFWNLRRYNQAQRHGVFRIKREYP